MDGQRREHMLRLRGRNEQPRRIGVARPQAKVGARRGPDALARLNEVVNSVAVPPRVRRATKPTYGSKQRRLEGKSQRSETKSLRGKVQD